MLQPTFWIGDFASPLALSPAAWQSAAASIMSAVVALGILAAMGIYACHVVSTRARKHRENRDAMMSGAELISPQTLRTGTRVVADLAASGSGRAVSGVLVAVTAQHLEIDLDAGFWGPPTGTPVEIIVTAAGAAYRGQTYSVENRVANGKTLMVISRPSWLARVQRRGHFRAVCEIAAIFAPIPASDGELAVYRCMLYDLSGSGVSIGSPVSLPVGRSLRARVPVPERPDMSVELKVRRESTGRAPDLPYLLHCEFTGLTEEMQNLIVLRCFELQKHAIRTRNRPDEEGGETKHAA